jgi:uridine monophosphate synthetase
LPPQKEQLVVTDVVVLIDREQGGADHLAKNGLQLHAAFKLSAMLDVLLKHQLVDEATAQKVRPAAAGHPTACPFALGL